MLEYLFAPRDETRYPPCGMFTLPHFIILFVFIVLLCLALFLSKNIKENKVRRICKILAIVFTILETIKILYNLLNDYKWLDAWFPLAYCSLFIYSLYLVCFNNKMLNKNGYCFLTGGGIIAGSFFLIFPTTSLMSHPIYHYLCIYSMLFHSSMIYVGIILLKSKTYQINIKDYFYYLIYLTVFSIIAITINNFFDCNMMFYKEPYNMPIKVVVDIYNFSKIMYIFLIYFAYASLFVVTCLGYNVIIKQKKGKLRKNESY